MSAQPDQGPRADLSATCQHHYPEDVFLSSAASSLPHSSTPTRPTREPITVTREVPGSISSTDQDIHTNDATPIRTSEVQSQSIDTPSFRFPPGHRHTHSRSSAAGLSVQTDLDTPVQSLRNLSPSRFTPLETNGDNLLPERAALSSMSSYFSLHASRSYDYSYSMSPSSALPSPALSAMIDITPLPSPLFPGDPSPRRLSGPKFPSRSSSLRHRTESQEAMPARSNSVKSRTSPRKSKGYGGLMPATVEAQAANAQNGHNQTSQHGRNRSISDFVPEQLYNVRQRVATFGSGAFDSQEGKNLQAQHAQAPMQREEYLAAQRGLTQKTDPSKTLPSPPPSNKSVTEEEADDEEAPPVSEEAGVEYFSLSAGPQNRKRKWRSIRQLGQGTFSKVLLATSERLPPDLPPKEDRLDPQKLVAVKICEHGPAGGADEERIKHSLDREIEILKSVSHPSIVHLKALEETPTKTFLVLTYCTGGDLFELASTRRDLLTPPLVRRMFAELVNAVRYLHKNWIVHRDIKLENVLVNAPASYLATITDPQTHPSPLITLTDLGLSRRIPPPPASPLLSTRCGSEDYAAPEILLGQPYDGRSTDGWALGVLLYALMEGRLPFDAPPGRPERSRNTHRIARCDWIWCRYGDEDGEWDPNRGKGWEGAEGVVGALLRKARMGRKSLEEVETWDWVSGGIRVESGMVRKEDDGGVLVLPE